MKAHIEMIIWPPSGNHQHYKNRRLTKEARIWQQDTHTLLLLQRLPSFKVPVSAVVWFYPPNAHAMDFDNYEKPMWDAIVRAGVIPSDSNKWLKRKLCEWGEPRRHGLMTIDLEEYVKGAGMIDWPEGAAAYLKCPGCGRPGVWLRRTFTEEDQMPHASDAFRDDGQQLHDGQYPECQHCQTRLNFELHLIIAKGEGDE